MKTYNIVKRAAAVVTTMLAVAGCVQNETQPEPDTIDASRLRFEVTATYTEGGDADTRAVKPGWAVGDVLLVHFDGGEANSLWLQYNEGGEWDNLGADTPSIKVAGGSAQALHAISLHPADDVDELPEGALLADGDLIYTDTGNYIVIGDAVYVSLHVNKRVTSRVTVEGLDTPGEWVLAGPDLAVSPSTVIVPGAFDAAGGKWADALPPLFVASDLAAGAWALPYVMPYNEAGSASYFVRDLGTAEGTTLRLYNGVTRKIWERTYDGDLVTGEAVVVQAPDGTGEDGWADITPPEVDILTEENFPDANFLAWCRAQLTARSWDTNGDGKLTAAEAATVTNINVGALAIASLEGIEYFTGLTSLSCGANELTTLDVSANTALTLLDCNSNSLTSLNVSGCLALTLLHCTGNQLTLLDVSTNTALTQLQCANNKLTSLDVSANTALTQVVCHINQLTSLTLPETTTLTGIECSENQLTSLDVSKNTALEGLSFSNNYLTSIDVSNNTELIGLSCGLNLLTSLDISANTKLMTIYCYDNPGNSVNMFPIKAWFNNSTIPVNFAYNPAGWDYNGAGIGIYFYTGNEDILTEENFPDANFLAWCRAQLTAGSWDTNGDGKLTAAEAAAVTWIELHEQGVASMTGIEHFTGLTALSVIENLIPLTTLDLSANTALTRLDIQATPLTALDVSKNTALTELLCHHCELTTLDVSKNTALTSLECAFNQLTTLDVSKNTALTSLSCHGNQLSALDVSNNTALTTLSCGLNQFTSLDVSANTALTGLSCESGLLTTLDVSNNTALTTLSLYQNRLTSLDVSGCSELYWLNVDDNLLTSLELSTNIALGRLYAEDNRLTSLDLSNNSILYVLYLTGNPGNGVSWFPVKLWEEFDFSTMPLGFQSESWQYGGNTIAADYYTGDAPGN